MDHTTGIDPSSPAASNGHHHPDDGELDALADLFLGPADHAHAETTGHASRREREPEPIVPSVRLEAVILGHLPISASAWPGQYARRRAEQTGGPVAVIRLGAGSLTVDLLGAGSPEPRPASDREALALARRAARVIIIRVDESSEGELAVLPGLDSLCLLTGADDAAVVACYRKLKALAAGSAQAIPPAHLTIMGAEPERGRIAHERIARAAREFLDADLLDPVVIDRIGPTGSVAVFRGPSEFSVAEIGQLLTRPLSDPLPAAQPASRPTVAPGGSNCEDAGPVRTPTIEPPNPKPAAAPEHRPTERLCSLVEGVEPIESSCPISELTELGVDESGRLHLVAAALATAPRVSSSDPVGDLLRTASWARTHAALLCKAEPSLRQADGVMHLVTDDPRAAARLAGSLVRVHLAVPARPAAFGLSTVEMDA